MDMWAKEIKRGRIARVAILSLGQSSEKKRQEEEKEKGPGPRTPKTIRPSFFSQIGS